MSQDNRLIGALTQPEARNEARQEAQSQRYARIRRQKRFSERKKEGSAVNEERNARKLGRTKTINKQTIRNERQAAFQPVMIFVTERVKMFYLLETNCSTEEASELGSDTKRDEGGGRSSSSSRPGRNGESLKTQTLTLSLICLLIRLLFHFHSVLITTSPLFLFPRPKASTSPFFS